MPPAGKINSAQYTISLLVVYIWDATFCVADQIVVSNACVACPAGKANDAGDDASGQDTKFSQDCE